MVDFVGLFEKLDRQIKAYDGPNPESALLTVTTRQNLKLLAAKCYFIRNMDEAYRYMDEQKKEYKKHEVEHRLTGMKRPRYADGLDVPVMKRQGYTAPLSPTSPFSCEESLELLSLPNTPREMTEEEMQQKALPLSSQDVRAFTEIFPTTSHPVIDRSRINSDYK